MFGVASTSIVLAVTKLIATGRAILDKQDLETSFSTMLVNFDLSLDQLGGINRDSRQA